jgi:hypothetical protein
MADPQYPNRPARVTPNLGIPVPADQDLADYVTGWGQVADATDTAVKGAVDNANTGFSSAISSAQAAALPYALLMMGA